MIDGLLEDLKQLGVDVDASIARFVGNKELYVKFLKKFPEDPNYAEMVKNFSDKDYENALKSSHALKGLTGNLGLNYMYQRLSKMVDDLRKCEYNELENLLEEIKENYKCVCDRLEEE